VGVAGPPTEIGVAGCQTVEETQHWLVENRFGQFCSLFANYTNLDLLRLSRRDIVQLCGQADGIRLFNALRVSTLKTIYVLLPGEKGQWNSAVEVLASCSWEGLCWSWEFFLLLILLYIFLGKAVQPHALDQRSSV